MHINISICDDESTEIEYLKMLAIRWSNQREITLRVNTFESAESFLFAYEEDKDLDILLLDIQMKGMDGVQLARQIRQDNEAMQIIFITGFPDFMTEGFEVSALHYLMKPVSEQKLFEVLNRAVNCLHKIERAIFITSDRESVRIPVGNIQYAEIFSHTVSIQTIDGCFETRMTIRELQEQLGQEFIRCHRSFIVGLKAVHSITKTEVCLDNGQRLPISRNAYNEVNRAFILKYSREEK